MEPYITISFLNDFIFCPRSIYFHQIYAKTDESLYHTTSQSEGKSAHSSIDTKTYTTSKKVHQSIEIYSSIYGIGGKIDTYDEQKKLLVERKKKIKVIYDGYIYQLYAQYYCLTEMGYEVDKIKLHSLDDNKSYEVALPQNDPLRKQGFEMLLKNIHSFDLNAHFEPNPNKCKYCIYSPLCDVSAC